MAILEGVAVRSSLVAMASAVRWNNCVVEISVAMRATTAAPHAVRSHRRVATSVVQTDSRAARGMAAILFAVPPAERVPVTRSVVCQAAASQARRHAVDPVAVLEIRVARGSTTGDSEAYVAHL